jgi:hypothetical protein
MQQPLTYIIQTLFQHEVFVITPTLNAGSRCSRHVSHGNTIIVFLIFCTNLQKIDETWTLLNTELSFSKMYKVGILSGTPERGAQGGHRPPCPLVRGAGGVKVPLDKNSNNLKSMNYGWNGRNIEIYVKFSGILCQNFFAIVLVN